MLRLWSRAELPIVEVSTDLGHNSTHSLQEYYEILRSEAHEGYLELKKNASAETLGSGILAASRCLPPSSLLRQGTRA
jgi:hypothetical protein